MGKRKLSGDEVWVVSFDFLWIWGEKVLIIRQACSISFLTVISQEKAFHSDFSNF